MWNSYSQIIFPAAVAHKSHLCNLNMRICTFGASRSVTRQTRTSIMWHVLMCHVIINNVCKTMIFVRWGRYSFLWKLNFSLFLTQSYYMTSADYDYSAWITWTAFAVFLVTILYHGEEYHDNCAWHLLSKLQHNFELFL